MGSILKKPKTTAWLLLTVALSVAVFYYTFQKIIESAQAQNAVYYVCNNANTCNAGKGVGWSTGSDSYSKVQAQNKSTPWSTIDHAEENVVAGDTVIVGDGVYSATSQEWNDQVVLYVQASGAPGKMITFKSENKWGAVMDGQNQSQYGGIWFDCDQSPPASYIRIEDFEISNFQYVGVNSRDNDGKPYTRCSHIELHGLKIHTVGDTGINLQEMDQAVVENNLIYDLTATHTNHNQFHGIYISDNTDNIVIRNNIVYGTPEGWPVHIYDGHGYGDATNHLVINNTLIDENPYRDGGLVLYGENHTVRNNIMFTVINSPNYNAAIYDSGSGGIIENNITNQPNLCTRGCPGAAISKNVLSADLSHEFTDPANRIYSLQSQALSRDSGTSVGAPDIDYAGNIRPQGTGYDVGAYEYQAPQPSCLFPDLTCNQTVDLADLISLKSLWGNNLADFNQDTYTNLQDLGIMMGVWGSY